MPKNLKTWPRGCTITIYINPRVHISKCCLFWHPHLISFKIQMSDHSSDNSNRCQLLHRSKSFFIINPTPSIVRCEKPRATNRANEIKIEPSLLRFTCHTLTTRNLNKVIILSPSDSFSSSLMSFFFQSFNWNGFDQSFFCLQVRVIWVLSSTTRIDWFPIRGLEEAAGCRHQRYLSMSGFWCLKGGEEAAKTGKERLEEAAKTVKDQGWAGVCTVLIMEWINNISKAHGGSSRCICIWRSRWMYSWRKGSWLYMEMKESGVSK